jgi:hypothetical protein
MAEKKSDEEVTLKDARKKFKLGNVENGIVIKGYVGEDDSVNIPKIIGGKKVLSIEVRTFFARNMTVTGLERYESTFQKEQLHNANVGDTVTFGTYCFEKDGQNAKIDWSVVAKEEDKMLLLTKQAIDVLPFNRLHKDSVWENSDIRKWLNDIFLQYAFSGEEMSLIQTSSVSNNGNENFGVKGSDITNDKVFLLSIEEVLKLSEVKIGKGAEPTPYAKSKKPVIVGGLCRWWLRTPGKDVGDVAFVAENETIMGMDPHRALGHGLWDDTADIAIRPAIWIKI